MTVGNVICLSPIPSTSAWTVYIEERFIPCSIELIAKPILLFFFLNSDTKLPTPKYELAPLHWSLTSSHQAYNAIARLSPRSNPTATEQP